MYRIIEAKFKKSHEVSNSNESDSVMNIQVSSSVENEDETDMKFEEEMDFLSLEFEKLCVSERKLIGKGTS